MSRDVSLIAFGTFGNPNGFRQTLFAGNKELSKHIATFDLNTNAIKLFRDSKIYSIRKEKLNGIRAVSYSIYSFAKEPNTERSGTFIGSSLLFTNEVSDENLTVKILDMFHNDIFNSNIKNGIIQVNHSDRLSVRKPTDFEKLTHNLQNISNVNFSNFSNKFLVVYTKINFDKVVNSLKRARELLNKYDTIYFTDSSEIAEFVHQKGLFKLIKSSEYDQEFALIQEEKRIKTANSISSFKQEKQKLTSDKKNVLSDLNQDYENYEKIHIQNEKTLEEYKRKKEKINLLYNEFSQKIDEYINQLKSGRKLEQVKEIYEQNKGIFISSISDLSKPNYVSKIPKARTASKLEKPYYKKSSFSDNMRPSHNSSSIKETKKIDIFKISTFFLLTLWITTLLYFLVFKPKPDTAEVNMEKQIPAETNVTTKPTKNVAVKKLNPIPNSELNSNDYNLVAKNINYNLKIDDLVKVIFNKNPTEIQSIYSGQELLYAKYLLERNKQCFKEKDGINYFVKDTIRHIPSFKQ